MEELANSIGAKWAALVTAVLTLSVTALKLLNSVKGDINNGNMLDRVSALEKKAVVQDAQIHRQAVRGTKLAVLVIRLEGILTASGIEIPETVRAEIQELTSDKDLGE